MSQINKSMSPVSVVSVFDSIQGEGRYVGVRQLFVRLSGCPLRCPYCDTDHSAPQTFNVGTKELTNPVSAKELADTLISEFAVEQYHSISFTGGEPLLYPDFLKDTSEILHLHGAKTFLETSGHSPIDIIDISSSFDYLSVDLKGHIEPFKQHADRLLSAMGLLNQNKVYLKMPISPQDGDHLVAVTAPIFALYSVKQIWLQPIDNLYNIDQVSDWQKIFSKHGVEARFLPQVHKLMDIP